ncbi:transmembrane protein 19 isoform X2 [Orussus abietinus]|uniref:transmembrane protein 19 isoform X2 n=1 Tax=Orussus abietinus TaxID=222816 RepID=UPI00062613A6|nr:transmembrane protein 19 isoform X2 [Orussus abietinus]
MLLTASEDDRRNSVLVPVLVSAFAIPVSMLFWIVNVTYSLLAPDSEYQADGYPVISPWRWLAAVIIPIFMAGWALKKKTLDLSGALLGSFMGFVLTLSSFAHLGCLIAFFVTSSKATKFRAHRKKKVTEDFKINSRRNWIQVLCNGGATACCNGDTWASELGTVVGSSDPFLITSRKRVPRGTNGAVSWFGILVSLLGGLVLGLTYYIIILYTVDPAVLQSAAPQWPIIFAGGVGGLLGSLCDSFLGATLQYSGVDEQGMVVERPGKGVRHISGRQILDNHSVNLLSSIFTSLTLPRLANIFWPQ